VKSTNEHQAELIRLIQFQFGRVDQWCWETLLEGVSQKLDIPLNADRLTYAGGTLRTGRYWYGRNDKRWKEICHRIAQDGHAAGEVLSEIVSALVSEHATGAASRWRMRAERVIDEAVVEYRELAYRAINPNAFSVSRTPTIPANGNSIVYALWRIDCAGAPIGLLPSYIGETAGTSRNHGLWWGAPNFGLYTFEVDPTHRKEVEESLIHLITPFCNVKGNALKAIWNFPRPDDVNQLRTD
jgi:hypothetical protein